MTWRTQRNTNTVFQDTWNLYTSCRKNGVWAKLVLETSGNGEETFTFSSRRPSRPTSGTNPAPKTPAPPTPSESSRRKSPSKLRKDRVKWRSWLEKKLLELRTEEVPSVPCSGTTPSTQVADCAPVCMETSEVNQCLTNPVRQAQLDIPSSIQHRNEEDCSATSQVETCVTIPQEIVEKEDVYTTALKAIEDAPAAADTDFPTVTTPSGTTLTRLQPVGMDRREDAPPTPSSPPPSSTPPGEDTDYEQSDALNRQMDRRTDEWIVLTCIDCLDARKMALQWDSCHNCQKLSCQPFVEKDKLLTKCGLIPVCVECKSKKYKVEVL